MSYQGFLKTPKSFQSLLQGDKSSGGAPLCTKLACTVGPQTRSVEVLEQMLTAGMTIARFDFSVGDMDFHQESLDNLRLAMKNSGKLCAVLLGTMGPEIVVVSSPGESVRLEAGQPVLLTCKQGVKASAAELPISYPAELWPAAGALLREGHQIFLGDHLTTGSELSSACLTVQQVTAEGVRCVSTNKCVLDMARPMVFSKDLRNAAPVLTHKDVEIIKVWGARNAIDFVSVAFCRNRKDVEDCRKHLDDCGMFQTQIIARIETIEGLTNHEEIIAAANAITLSRGNIGICLEPEKVFRAQKMLLRACNLAGKPCYVTRVVDSMSDAPRPTRAEATDVANVVLDGADGILLGAETYAGKYPVLTLETVGAICRQAESCFDSEAFYQNLMANFGGYTLSPNMSEAEALASSAVRWAAKTHATLIIVLTVTGRTAGMVAKYKPSQPILAVVVPSVHSDGIRWSWTGAVQARQCLVYRGVAPYMADPKLGGAGGEVLDHAIAHARKAGLCRTGDRVVVSHCPRKGVYGGIMEEAGIIKCVEIGPENGPSTLIDLTS